MLLRDTSPKLIPVSKQSLDFINTQAKLTGLCAKLVSETKQMQRVLSFLRYSRSLIGAKIDFFRSFPLICLSPEDLIWTWSFPKCPKLPINISGSLVLMCFSSVDCSKRVQRAYHYFNYSLQSGIASKCS